VFKRSLRVKRFFVIDIVAGNHQRSHNFTLSGKEGWIIRCGADGKARRVCWLPHERRFDGKITFFGERVCVGAQSGMVTILDFSQIAHD
jgi:hypothetical protein